MKYKYLKYLIYNTYEMGLRLVSNGSFNKINSAKVDAQWMYRINVGTVRGE